MVGSWFGERIRPTVSARERRTPRRRACRGERTDRVAHLGREKLLAAFAPAAIAGSREAGTGAICGVPQPGMHMLRSARLQKLAGAAAFAGAGAAILCSPATQCEAEQRKGTGPLQRRSSVSDSINVVRADRSLAGAKPLSGQTSCRPT